MFLNDFGQLLAPMISVLPQERPADVSDKKTLRFAARVKDDSGFLFFNNYQRLAEMNNFENCRVDLELKKEKLQMPRKPFNVKKGTYFIWPFNLAVNDALLKYSTTQLLCKINHSVTNTYFFFAVKGIDAEYAFDSTTIKSIKAYGAKISSASGLTYISDMKPGMECIIHIVTASGAKVDIVTLASEQAKYFWKGQAWGRERVFLSRANLLFERNDLKVYSTDPTQMSFSVYPAAEEELFDGFNKLPRESNGLFTRYVLTKKHKHIRAAFNDRSSAGESKEQKNGHKEWLICMPQNIPDGASDLFLRIHYVGDTARAYINGKLVADNFYNGLPWEIGLKRFASEVFQTGLVIQITPMRDQSQVYLEDWAKMPAGQEPNIQKIEVLPEYSASIVQSSQLPSAAVKKPELSLSND
jgi:hypothetical protein